MFSLADLRFPVLQAPMAGGPSTPALAAAVSRAGGLGFLAGGYLTASALAEQIAAVDAAAAGPYGVNLFVPETVPTDRAALARYAEALEPWRKRFGLESGPLPEHSDDDWAAKTELLLEHPVPVVSFAFGLPGVELVRGLQSAGSLVLLSVASAEEAAAAAALGPDALVVQAAAAGGHRATLRQDAVPEAVELPELLRRVRSRTKLPLVAAGGIATGPDVRRALAGGAVAVQVGTAFAVAEEAGTASVHRKALLAATAASPTVVTRTFSGRPARALVNEFTRGMGPEEIVGYPEVHFLTSPIRAAARGADDAEAVNLWAGTGVGSVRAGTAEQILGRLVEDLD